MVENVRPEVDKVPKRVVGGRSRSPMRERKKSETEVEVEVDGMKELHVTLSPRTPAGDPPEPEELIKALLVREQFPNGSKLLVKVPPKFLHVVRINCTALNDECVLNVSLGVLWQCKTVCFISETECIFMTLDISDISFIRCKQRLGSLGRP